MTTGRINQVTTDSNDADRVSATSASSSGPRDKARPHRGRSFRKPIVDIRDATTVLVYHQRSPGVLASRFLERSDDLLLVSRSHIFQTSFSSFRKTKIAAFDEDYQRPARLKDWRSRGGSSRGWSIQDL